MLNKQREWSQVRKQIYGVTFCRCGICSLGEILPSLLRECLAVLSLFCFLLRLHLLVRDRLSLAVCVQTPTCLLCPGHGSNYPREASWMQADFTLDLLSPVSREAPLSVSSWLFLEKCCKALVESLRPDSSPKKRPLRNSLSL